jgi:hypothetical protein
MVELFQIEVTYVYEVSTNIPKQCQEPWKKSDTMSSTQPPLMNIIQVFCWFSHGLSTLPESSLKPWEETHHSHGLNIE